MDPSEEEEWIDCSCKHVASVMDIIRKSDSQASYIHHPRSKDPGRIQGHHQGQTICLPQIEDEKQKLEDFRLILSCYAHLETVCAYSARLTNGALFSTGCHGDFATTNETKWRRDDGAENRSNMPTWLWNGCLNKDDEWRMRWLKSKVCARTLFAEQQRGQLRLRYGLLSWPRWSLRREAYERTRAIDIELNAVQELDERE